MTIIRDMPTADGGESWVLLSQVEHARVSGEFAANWDRQRWALRDEMVEAVFHHDDGWAEWERRPGVDAASGRPIAFTEMPDDTKFDIWRASIDAARGLGSLAGVMVARHFIELPRGTNAWQETASELGTTAKSFIEQYRELADRWLAEWIAEDATNTKEDAQRGLQWLQMFDLVSLWLCMTEPTESRSVELPGGGQIVLAPESPERIRVDPWPFCKDHVRLEIEGRRVPVWRYADASDLAAQLGDSVVLTWELMPGRVGQGHRIKNH